MNQRPFCTWKLTLLILVISGLILTGCAPSVVAEGQLKPTQAASTFPPYPGSTLATTALLPTAAPTVSGIWGPATPLPNEQFTVGEITPFTPPARRYSVRQELRAEEKTVYMLFVRDNQTGKEFRLGDDSGDAEFEAMSDQYIIWQWYCYPCGENPILQAAGTYAYVLKTNEYILLTQAGDQSEVAGDWVIYLSHEGIQDYPGLHAHNITTGEDILLTKAMPIFRGRLTRDGYTVNENKAAWVDLEPAANEISIKVYDLDTHTGQKLTIPTPTEPLFIGVSREVVIWRDRFWKGYLLKHNALLTIPVVPPGWENMTYYESRPITAQGNRLYWTFKVDDDFYYFTAPIVPKGQGVQPTHVVPTPHRKPTVSPVAITPTPIPLPTAYP